MRWFHRAYAFLFGYFWLPCHLCGVAYGGHQWRTYDGQPCVLKDGRGICPTCTKAGLGSHWRVFTS